ncbi:MAG: hypothetical protein FJX40_13900 [Alphaproteobacteria bacterium]|nr:hypothetical protein [Alphaproteobacteria bacterium]MBM3641847.1 hypothetical protein [Alphaproteobacteria bacterium]
MPNESIRAAADSIHVAAPIAVAAGASVSALLITGTWPERFVAAAVGGAFSWVATPIFAPLMQVGVVWIYQQAGADPAMIPGDAIPGLTGFTLGVVGLDACAWFTRRVKYGLSLLKLPGFKPPEE